MKPGTIQFYRNRGGWQILLPQLADPVANTVTTRANQMGATNIISSAHYPINGVLEIYETKNPEHKRHQG